MVILNRSKIKLNKFLRMLSIRRRELVLDVGSGDGPFARANVLCDKYVSNTENRIGPIAIDRPFVAGDVMALPFRDNAFDYVFCSHVLEHVEDPEKAIKELVRIGRKGFLEIPSEFLEKIKCSPGHRWYVRLEGRTLVFREKEGDIFDPFIQEMAEEKLVNRDRSFMNFYWKNYYTLFNIAYEWSGEIKFEIIRLKGDRVADNLKGKDLTCERSQASREGGCSTATKGIIKSIIKSVYSKCFDLYELLACPLCKGLLEKKEGNLICYNCRKGFYIKDDIPILIEGYSFDI